MAALTETSHAGEFLLSSSGMISRDAVTVASGQNLAAGAVLGRLNRRQAASPIPTIVGTGTGLMSNLRFGPDVQVGSYVITLLATSATAAFSVTAPDGTALPNGAVATAYSTTHLSFLIANGGTMTIGDAFTVVVTAGGTPVLVGTGSGTVSGVTLGRLAQNGTYRITLKATSATAEFQVVAPNGLLIGYGNVATAYTSDHVNFTLANGGTMTVGDYFNIVVANGLNTVVAWDPAAVDGTQDVCGILFGAVDASSAAAGGAMVSRLAEVKSSMLVYKAGVSAASKAMLTGRMLSALNIIAR
jgi:hypothetical protein